MLKLLFMVACEKVIFDREDETASLINILEGIRLETSEQVPEEAEIPQLWVVYSMWRKQEEADDKTFEQRVEIVSPKGQIAKQHDTPFGFLEGKMNHRVKLNIIGLPIGEAGIWSINISFREHATDAEWSYVASYPFEVDHGRS